MLDHHRPMMVNECHTDHTEILLKLVECVLCSPYSRLVSKLVELHGEPTATPMIVHPFNTLNTV